MGCCAACATKTAANVSSWSPVVSADPGGLHAGASDRARPRRPRTPTAAAASAKARALQKANQGSHLIEVTAAREPEEAPYESFGALAVDPMPRARKRKTLVKAVKENDMPVVTQLLQAGADLEELGMWDNTPLLVACSAGHAAIALMLVSRRANIFAANEHGATPMHYAAVEGLQEVVTTLIAATKESDVKLVPGLINCSLAKVYNRHLDCYGKRRPLGSAAENGFTEIVETLLDAGADTEVGDEGRTPLWLACKQSRLPAVKALLRRHANAAAKDSQGVSVLEAATSTCNEDIVLALLAHGVGDVNDTAGSPLQDAVRCGRKAVAEALLTQGARVHPPSTGHSGLTPLHVACERGDEHLVALLVRNKADPSKKDTTGRSSFDLLRRRGYPDSKVMELLMPLHQQPGDGSTGSTAHLADGRQADSPQLRKGLQKPVLLEEELGQDELTRYSKKIEQEMQPQPQEVQQPQPQELQQKPPLQMRSQRHRTCPPVEEGSSTETREQRRRHSERLQAEAEAQLLELQRFGQEQEMPTAPLQEPQQQAQPQLSDGRRELEEGPLQTDQQLPQPMQQQPQPMNHLQQADQPDQQLQQTQLQQQPSSHPMQQAQNHHLHQQEQPLQALQQHHIQQPPHDQQLQPQQLQQSDSKQLKQHKLQQHVQFQEPEQLQPLQQQPPQQQQQQQQVPPLQQHVPPLQEQAPPWQQLEQPLQQLQPQLQQLEQPLQQQPLQQQQSLQQPLQQPVEQPLKQPLHGKQLAQQLPPLQLPPKQQHPPVYPLEQREQEMQGQAPRHAVEGSRQGGALEERLELREARDPTGGGRRVGGGVGRPDVELSHKQAPSGNSDWEKTADDLVQDWLRGEELS